MPMMTPKDRSEPMAIGCSRSKSSWIRDEGMMAMLLRDRREGARPEEAGKRLGDQGFAPFIEMRVIGEIHVLASLEMLLQDVGHVQQRDPGLITEPMHQD